MTSRKYDTRTTARETPIAGVRRSNVTDAPGYYLLQPTINAYLTHLTRTGDLSHEVASNQSTLRRS